VIDLGLEESRRLRRIAVHRVETEAGEPRMRVGVLENVVDRGIELLDHGVAGLRRHEEPDPGCRVEIREAALGIGGTEGATACRFGLAMPMPLSLPELMWVMSGDKVAATAAMWPPSTAVMAGAPPGNGTCTICVLASTLNRYSAAMNEPLPTPAVPNSTLLVFAAVMSSARLLTGLAGWATIASGAEPTIAAGLMSSVA
jgi:hypothetical protein